MKKEVPPSGAFPRKAYLLTTLWLYLIWLLLGLGLWFVLANFGTVANPLSAAGAYALGWMAGYLFLLVPGGFGVKEGIFTWLMGGAAGPALVAVFSRLALTIWEIIGFLVGLGVRPKSR